MIMAIAVIQRTNGKRTRNKSKINNNKNNKNNRTNKLTGKKTINTTLAYES